MVSPLRLLSLIFLLSVPWVGWATNSPRQVVLISVDGLRPDVITATNAPLLYAALQHSVYSLKAENMLPSLTVPNHLSMLSGLSGEEHGVRWNSARPGLYRGETLFHAVAAEGGRSTAFVAKKKLGWLLDPAIVSPILIAPKPNAAQVLQGWSASSIVQAFAGAWRENAFSFALVHLREPDSAGHDHGWMSDEYLQAVRVADEAVGAILDVIDSRTTAVIITSDHGGSDDHHHLDLDANRTIPWIALLPGVGRKVEIKESVRINDTAPTIATLLGYRWTWTGSGRVIETVVVAAGAKEYPLPAPEMLPAAGLPESAARFP